MSRDLSHYIILAQLFRYPSEELIDHSRNSAKIIRNYDPELTGGLVPFLNHIENSTLEYQQEYFVSTFDVQAVCCLDIGYALFGEDYRRGQLLANLKAEHRKAGNDCGTDLPDNLVVLLTLLPKLQDTDFAEELIFSLIIPAIKKITTGFGPNENHYKALLEIVSSIMEKDFPCSKYEQFQTAKI